jgi:hypothetical protein
MITRDLILLPLFAFVSCANPHKQLDEFYNSYHNETRLFNRFERVNFTPRGAYYIVDLLDYGNASFRIMRTGEMFNSDSSIALMGSRFGMEPNKVKTMVESLYVDFKALNIIALSGSRKSGYSFEFPDDQILVYVPDTSQNQPFEWRDYIRGLRSRAFRTYDDKWFAYTSKWGITEPFGSR